MSKKFHVQGIPKLVLLDGETGKTISTEGYSHITEDVEGVGFPWKTQTFTEIIPGTLVNNKSEQSEALEVLKNKFVGIYFSANWVGYLAIMLSRYNVML